VRRLLTRAALANRCTAKNRDGSGNIASAIVAFCDIQDRAIKILVVRVGHRSEVCR
jgi:hypothetical protein